MFKQGDYVIYSLHGVCIVKEICEKVIDKEKKMYYILHPVNEAHSKIMTPVENQKVKMRLIMTPEEANKILLIEPDSNPIWNLDKNQRSQEFTKVLKEGNPGELVKFIKVSMMKEDEKKAEGKKITATDKKYLEAAEKLLYSELSFSLSMEIEQIKNTVIQMVQNELDHGDDVTELL